MLYLMPILDMYLRRWRYFDRMTAILDLQRRCDQESAVYHTAKFFYY